MHGSRKKNASFVLKELDIRTPHDKTTLTNMEDKDKCRICFRLLKIRDFLK
jgi:hypothetical protein